MKTKTINQIRKIILKEIKGERETNTNAENLTDGQINALTIDILEQIKNLKL